MSVAATCSNDHTTSHVVGERHRDWEDAQDRRAWCVCLGQVSYPPARKSTVSKALRRDDSGRVTEDEQKLRHRGQWCRLLGRSEGECSGLGHGSRPRRHR